MTYLQYHLIFILPPLLLLAALSLPAARRGSLAGRYRPEPRWVNTTLALFPLIPLLYTTPWDNYLVARGVWSYPATRVLARVGSVPVEEYAFFVLQTLVTSLWLLTLLRRGGPARSLPQALIPWVRWGGAAGWLLLALAGALALRAPHTFYLGLILSWACPVLAGLWAFGGDLVAAQGRVLGWGVLPPTLYLWLTDWVAIRAGIWSISAKFTGGLGVAGLPAEEMLFFLVTNLLIVTGLLLFLHPLAYIRVRRLGELLRGGVVRPWMGFVALYALLKIPVPLWPQGFTLLATLSTVCLALAALSWAWDRVGPRALGLAALAFAVGLGVEVLGSRTGLPFGSYRYGSQGIRLLGVPLLVPLGWFAMTLAAAVLARGRAWLAGLLLVAWDLGLEPLMTAQKVWSWGSPLKGVVIESWARAQAPGAVWAGAPGQNFLAWFVIGAGLSWIFGRLAPELFGRGRGGEILAHPAPALHPSRFVPDFRLAYLIESFFLPAGLLLLGQPWAALVTLIGMGGVVWISWRLA